MLSPSSSSFLLFVISRYPRASATAGNLNIEIYRSKRRVFTDFMRTFMICV
jgi:hypothetical protein